MKLVCKHCEKEWEYNGQQQYYCSCPSCMYKVKIVKNTNKKKE